MMCIFSLRRYHMLCYKVSRLIKDSISFFSLAELIKKESIAHIAKGKEHDQEHAEAGAD